MNVVNLSPGYYPEPQRGRPIANGKIYVGIPDTDPTVASNQKTLSVRQEDGTVVEVAQPIYTNAGGVPVYSASPVTLLVSGDYSLAVLTANDVQAYYAPTNEDMIDAAQDDYYPDASATDQGDDSVDGDNNTINYYVDQIGSDEATIVLRHNSGSATTTYNLDTDETIPSNITLKFERGAIIDGAGTLTVEGNLSYGDYPIFGSSISISGVGTYYPDATETDQGVVGDGNTLKNFVDQISSDKATIVLKHNSGSATTTYTLTTSETIPSNITLKFERGAQIDGAGTLTVNGELSYGNYPIFGSSITVANVGVFYPDPNEADQGAVGDGNTIKNFVDQIGSDEATIVLRHTAGGGTVTYNLDTDETIPSNITLKVERGAIIDAVTGDETLTINGEFDAGVNQIFGSSITVDFSSCKKITQGYPDWFADADYGAKINSVWNSGISKVKIPQGTFSYSTTIDVPTVGAEVYYLEGSAVSANATAGTILDFTATDGSNAIEVSDASTKTRAVLRDFMLTGNANAGDGIYWNNVSRMSKIENVWVEDFTNTNYAGIRLASTAEDGFANIFSLTDIVIRNCDYGLFIDSTNIFSVYGGTFQGNNKRNLRLENVRRISFYGVTIQGCNESGGYSIQIKATSRNVRGIAFYACHIEESTVDWAFLVDASDGYNINLLTFRDCQIAFGTDSAGDTALFKFTGGNDMTALFSGNYLKAHNGGAGDATLWNTTGTTTVWDEYNIIVADVEIDDSNNRLTPQLV